MLAAAPLGTVLAIFPHTALRVRFQFIIIFVPIYGRDVNVGLRRIEYISLRAKFYGTSNQFFLDVVDLFFSISLRIFVGVTSR